MHYPALEPTQLACLTLQKTHLAGRRWLRSLAAAAVLALVPGFPIGTTALAEVPPVPTGFPRQTFTPGQLLYRNVGQSRITNIVYHNGNLYTNTVASGDRKNWRWTNTNSISSLTDVTPGGGLPPFMDVGNHAHTKVGDYVVGGLVHESFIKRSGVGTNTYIDDFAEVGANNSGHRMFYPWSVNFDWVQYAGLNGSYPSRIYRGDALLWQGNAYAEHGVAGYTILLGNYMFVISDDSDLGILSYDISPIFETPARPPTLLDKLTGPIGAYLPSIWQNYLILAQNGQDKIEVVDISDPTDLRLVTTINNSGNPAFRGDTSVPYVQAQDNFIFTQGAKVDMDTFRQVLQFDHTGNNRPAGSVAGEIDTSQYMMPLGNLLVTGAYSHTGKDALGVWAHQAAPDTKAPYVGYHVPRPGQTNFPLGAPISLVIHETLESYTIVNGDSVILRPIGGSPVDCYTSFSHDDILTITPRNYLTANTTYEVVIPAGGIKDASGNGIEAYTFQFSTGGSLAGGNRSPVINSFTHSATPSIAPGGNVTFTASASDPESNALQYRFSFGDGTGATAWGSSSTASRTYPSAGHYEAKVQVRDTKPDGTTSVVSKTLTVTVVAPPPTNRPTNSSTIAVDQTNRRVWVVNPDSDTVAVLNADTNAKTAEYNLASLLGISVGRVDPRGVAIDGSGNAWVACHDADRVAVISGSGGLVGSINTGYGTAPVAVAVSPDGANAFVTLTGSGVLKRYATGTRAETGSLPLGPTPRAIAVTGDGSRVLVTRFISTENYGQVWDVSSGTSLALTRTIALARDRGARGADGSSNGKGVPNYVGGIAISPDGAWAWYTAVKHNTQRGDFFNLGTGINGPLTPDHTSRSMVGRIQMSSASEPNVDSWDSNRLDVDNSDSPTGVIFSPLGDYAFVALQGNNEMVVYDDLSIRAGGAKMTTSRIPVGLAPQGLALDRTTGKVFSQNFMDRNATVHNMTAFFANGSRFLAPVTTSTSATEKLPASVLAGKRSFYNAALKDTADKDRMSRESYISCASCHVDGMQDGRVWDFTQRGEGLRNTVDLRGRAGMGHGNVHWTANFDEIHDFENDIRDHFGGTGLINGTTVSTPLGAPKAGVSADLDNLAAYVSSLDNSHLPSSPFRNTDGTMTAAATAGQAVFTAQNCASCHSGTKFTESTTENITLRNVGTLRTSSGKRINETLTGIDTPTLLGAWNTAPYFHDGSARTLDDVFVVAGGTVYQAESGLVAGGAVVPGFIDINADSAVHGAMVELNDGTITLSNVNGGTGGTGAVELRHQGSGTLTVIVNGTTYTRVVNGAATNGEWRHTRWEGVALNSGASNTIVIDATTGGFSIDDAVVSTSTDLANANPHRRVLSVSATDRANLIAYLQQIDAKSAPVDPNPTLRDPENPANAVAGVNYDFHQFTAGLNDTNGLTPANRVSSGTWTSTLSAVPGQNADSDGNNYGLVYTGYINVPTDGTYTFYTNSDDGNKLQIGSTTVASDESPHGARWNTDSVNIGLKAGRHAFTLKFYENGGGDSLRVEYIGPGIARTELPASALFRVGVVATVATPSFSPTGGTYTSAQNVTISTTTSGATIRYTTNGSDPTSSSQLYTGAINLSTSTTLKARGFQAGWNDSAIATAVYTINSGPANYTFAANEGGSYTFTQPVDVAYGANGSFFYRYGVTGTIVFDNATFGDPIPGVVKSGYFKAAAGSTGTISREVWTGVTGTSVAAIPLSTTPNLIDTLTSFEAPLDAADNYGTRVRGYLVAPASGAYVFWISGDDNCQLWLSTDSTVANKGTTPIATVNSWTSSREWTREANQKSVPISLVAGQRYYIEALHKEGNGGDNLAVGWAKPGQAQTLPSEVIPGSVLAPYDAGIESGAIYELEPKGAAGKRLDVTASAIASGTAVQLSSDVNGNNQRWKLEDQGAGVYELTPQHATGMRLDVNGSSSVDGTKVQIWGDNDTNAQRWKLELQADGTYEIIPQHDITKRLKVNGGGTTDGTAVQSWSDDNSDAVRWRLLKQ